VELRVALFIVRLRSLSTKHDRHLTIPISHLNSLSPIRSNSPERVIGSPYSHRKDLPVEQSESGQPVYRHEDRERDFEMAIGDSENIEKISEHIEQYIGPVASVFHELLSDLVHIDVHIVEPTEERNFYTLVTSGMSDLPMAAPEGAEEFRYAELLIALPPDWPMGDDEWKQDENFWPIWMLKSEPS
jgi:hypothetical protein